MRFSQFWIPVVMLLQNVSMGFFIPLTFLGRWSPQSEATASSSSICFHVQKEKIDLYYNNGHLHMDIRNLTWRSDNELELILDNLHLVRIPKNVDLKNVIRAVKTVQSIKKNGLQVRLRLASDKDEMMVRYTVVDGLDGEFQVAKIIS